MRVALLAAVPLAQPVLADDWPQWGGPNGDFTVAAKGLAKKWPEGGPKQLWRRPLGDGYSAILHKGGRLFTMYCDGDNQVVVALDAGTGRTIWENRYPHKLYPDMRRNFGLGPNATPLIVGERIVSVGVDGRLRCIDLASGKLLWEHDLPAEFGRRKRMEEYGYSNSPLQYNGTAIVQVGGNEHAVIAFDPADGSAVWKSEPGGISYAPATLTRLGRRARYFVPYRLQLANRENLLAETWVSYGTVPVRRRDVAIPRPRRPAYNRESITYGSGRARFCSDHRVRVVDGPHACVYKVIHTRSKAHSGPGSIDGCGLTTMLRARCQRKVLSLVFTSRLQPTGSRARILRNTARRAVFV